MRTDQLCIGFNRSAHMPDGGLIQVLAPDRLQLCKPCWKAWSEADEGTDQ
jgi:hypothetical protein